MKKIFLILCIAALMCMTSLAAPVSAATLTVAADGTGDYTSLSAALNAASPGDTIYLQKGAYSESASITISKNNITIKGESADKVTLNMPGKTLTVTGSGCHIKDLKFQSDFSVIKVQSTSNCVIKNNIFERPRYGITTPSSSYNLIANNIIINPSKTYGIFIPSDFNLIENNTIIGGTNDGLRIYGVNNTIINNSIVNNTLSGISLNANGNNEIYLNTVSGNLIPVTKDGGSIPSWVSPSTVNYTYNGKQQSGIVGNYWGSSYSGTDEDSNGIGDTAFNISSNLGTDTAPLMGIWQDGNIVLPDVAKPVAGFTASSFSGQAPFTVTFTEYPSVSGTITSYLWDFGDGTTSTDQNPSHTYTKGGNYTVKLTVTGPGGSNSLEKADFIKVISTGADLNVTSISPIIFSHANNTISVTIKNQGTQDAGAFKVRFNIDEKSTDINVVGLTVGASTLVNISDSVDRHVNDTVPIVITADPDNAVIESDRDNNQLATSIKVIFNGYAGQRWCDGTDITTKKEFDLRGDTIYSLGNSVYGSDTVTWTASDLPIPAGATVKDVRLYVPYCWDSAGTMLGTTTMTFNGAVMPHEVHYRDTKNWGDYAQYGYGTFVFNVTDQFSTSGNNKAVFSHGYAPVRGMTLVVTYEDPMATEKQIFINDGFDVLYAAPKYYTTEDTATAYAPFNGTSINLSRVNDATLTTLITRGSSGETRGAMLFNNHKWPNYWVQSAAEIGVNTTNITPYLTTTNNTAMFRSQVSDNMDMEAYLAILKVEYESTSAPEANFTANTTSGLVPQTVKFTDTSTGTPTNWTWDFGDESTSTEQNPTHIYKSEGNYTVKLTVSNSLGSDSEEKIGYITVGSAVLAPETNFGSNVTSGNAPLSVQFKDESTNSPTGWEWNFGDGKTSTEQNPSHTYETVGTYTVNLTATNYGGSNSTTKTDYITVTSDTSAPVASFTPDANSGQVPFTVKFTDTSTGKVSSWNWDFGDGSTSTDQNPTHTYVAAGSYTVTLTATGPGGSNTATSAKPITVSASLSSPNYNGGIPLTTAQNGTVSGGLWCDSYPGFSTSAQKTFTLPDYTKIKWARLYVTVYDGHMENNYRGNVSIDIDANGDSKYELQKTETFDTTYSFPGTGGTGPVWLSDHMNRVTSDYLMWYDLTDLISGQKVNVQATTTKVDSSFDGRVKAMTLVVAYDDGDSDKVYYWINQGHDTVNPLDDTYTGSTSFGTSSLAKGWSSANLTAIFLASVDGTYSFQGTKMVSGTKSGSYYGSNTWDISSLLTAGQDSKLDYNKQQSNYYKIPLTLMSVRYNSSSPELPTADFKANVTSGTAPLSVNFTDQSTGSPTSWLWDFGDGTNATEQNPLHTYTAAGNYTVNLTVSSAAGNNSSQLVDLIKVTESPTPGKQPDLIVSAITPNAVEVFANEANNISAKVENIGTKASGPFTVTFTANSIDTNVTVDALEAGANTTVTIADPTIRVFGDNVTVTATADPENKIAESSEINNQMNITKTVVYNGYKGKRYTGGNDLLTQAAFEGKYGLVYSSGNTAYVSGNWAAKTYTWSSTDLPIPAGSTVESARLYQAYTWNKMATDPAFTMSFNSNTVTPVATYKDRKSYGSYDYPAGLDVYDVTSLFDPAGNSITVTPETGNDYGIYGAYLVVIYNDPAATEKKIWINDDFDLLASKDSYAVSSEEATAYASFSDVNATGISNATAIAVLASGNDNSKSKFVFNDNEYTGFWPDYQTTPQIGFSSYNVTGNLLNGTDTARLQSYDTGTGGDSMSAMNVILVADYGETPNETEAPVAVFTATPTSGTAPLTVNFTDQSTGTVSSYAWDFNNDGTIDSTEQNPIYTYAAAGSYAVNLTVSNADGSDSEEKTGYVKVTGSSPGKPVAAFSASPASGKTPLTVAFTDKSSNMPTKWKWSFGDGASSTIQNPKHKYSKAGKYTVILTVTNAKGSNTVTETDYIKVIAKPVANFNSSITSGKAPLNVVFTDTSTGTASSWIWDFGDGSKSFVENPTHKYSKAGTYTVNLTVKNAAGSNTVTKTEHIKVTAKPAANFTSSVTSGKAPLNVKFTDTSTGTPVTWKWTFGDVTSSTQQNPVHKYSKAGTYTVILTVKNAVGSNTVTKTDYIKVTEKPVAQFSASPTSGKAPLTVAFTDKSTGTPTKWKWNFGDGASSTVQSPKHKYSKAGSYKVTLTATNAAGSNMVIKTNYIKITA
jgi:parallel beta-helix repeat protein